MEEIIKQIINLDRNAVLKVKNIKEKEDNIEIYVNEKLKIERQKIDNRYLYKRKKIQEKYDLLFEKNKIELNQKKEDQIKKIDEKYILEKESIVNNVLEKILQRR